MGRIGFALPARVKVVATLHKKGDSWYCQFMFKRQRFNFSIGKVEEMEACNVGARADYILMRLRQNLMTLPDGMDIVTFIQHDGKPPSEVPTASAKREMPFTEFRESFIRTFSNGAIEANTLSTATIHLQHVATTLGDRFPIGRLAHLDLQKHIDRRRKDVAPITIHKEIDTLKAAWNWGTRMNYVSGNFPSHGLVYPKSVEKLHFMTWDEIERRIAAGGDDELWDCLYLTTAQMTKLLAFVKPHQAPPWFHPMLTFACHTGARRSEMMRCELQDIDLAAKWITIREKKKKRGQVTTRRVPMSSELVQVMTAWLPSRKGAKFVFGGRQGMLTVQAVQKAFVRVLKGSKWSVIRGWHTLRHSVVSAMASSGIDQRIIQDIVGHLTASMQRRYAHIYPATKEDAIRKVFG